MKNIITKLSIYAVAAFAAACCFTACEDEPDRFQLAEGKPTVYYVRPVKAAAADSLLTSAYMGNSICLVGENLRSVYKLMFNDQAAVLNNSYITDNTLLVDVPNEIPGKVSNLMYLITKNADTVKVDFQVLVPGPSIVSMKNEHAPAGTVSALYGDYFVDDPNVPLQLFVGDVEATIKDFSKGAITFEVPATAQENTPITVKTIYGEAKSAFYWMDNRGMLFNFDTDPHPANHGWHAQVIETDDTALDGNFLRLGGTDVTMDADGGWDDGHFSFEYWPGDWTEPISYNESPLLTDFADFSDWKNMSMKFELFVPSANPWMAGSMQLIVGGVDKISGSSAGPDIYGNTCAGANNTYFNGTSLPRGLYTPWVSTGSFDTGDEWITVTVPYSNFIYGADGTVASGPALTAEDFTSLLIFVWSGGNKGTECNPVIKIDNIRAVPNK
jgi:hypothetical protein